MFSKVEFADGQSQATITLYVRDDQEPEFAEVTYVRLTDIVEAGTQIDSQGAILGINILFLLIVTFTLLQN